MTHLVELAPLVTKLINGPLTHFYCYAGPNDRQGMFGQDKSIFLLKDLFLMHKPCVEVDHAYVLDGNRFEQFELQLPQKTIFLKEIVSDGFHPQAWNPDTTFLILPGGEAKKLQAQIGHKLKELNAFCNKGGLVWAICGSAYWLSRMRTFSFSNLHTLCTHNDLSLFPGSSYGPLPLPTQADATFKLTSQRIRMASSYFEVPTLLAGGGYFEFPQEKIKNNSTEVLARYVGDFHDQIAAVMCVHSKGVAVLMHPHVSYGGEEIDVESFRNCFPGRGDWDNLKNGLLNTSEVRMQFIAKLVILMCEKKLAVNIL